jgi:hypothetical protein
MTKRQNTKRERWDGEEAHRSNALAVVSEERQPRGLLFVA